MGLHLREDLRRQPTTFESKFKSFIRLLLRDNYLFKLYQSYIKGL